MLGLRLLVLDDYEGVLAAITATNKISAVLTLAHTTSLYP